MKKILVLIGLSLVSVGSLFSQTKIYNLPANIGTTWDWLPTTQGVNTVKINPSNLWLGIPFAIKDEGINLVGSGATSINFTGAGVTATQTSNAITVNIPAASGGGSTVTTTYVTQTADYLITDYTADDNVCKDWVIRGNSTNTISYPSGNATDGTVKWITRGAALDNTKVNAVFTCAKNGHIYANNIVSSLPVVADVIAPTWTTNTVTGISSTTATYNAQVSESGTVKYMVTTSSTAPSKAAILAGTGAVGTNFGSITMTGTTANTASLTGLTASTSYYLWAYAIDVALNESAVQSGVNFTTSAAGDVTPPTFTTNTVGTLAGTTATYNAQISETGSVKWMVTTSASAPTKAAILAGTGRVGTNSGSITMTGTTANTASLTGLTASTSYYLWSYAIDAANNESAIQSGVNFTTTSGAIWEDNFNRADGALGVAQTGQTYVYGNANTLSVVSNTCKNIGAAASSPLLAMPTSNWDVSFTISNLPSAITILCNLIGNNYIYVVGSTGQIFQGVAGTETSIGTSSATFAAGDVIRATRVGTTIQVFKNGTVVANANCSSTLTATNAGFSVGVNAAIDNLVVF